MNLELNDQEVNVLIETIVERLEDENLSNTYRQIFTNLLEKLD